jgi:arylsulfatase A-like enzyme
MFPSYLHHFKAHSHRTAAIGKLHLPDNPTHWLADTCDLLADVFNELTIPSSSSPPTFCALAGLPPMGTVDGVDATPQLRGDAPAGKEMASRAEPRTNLIETTERHRCSTGGS